MRRQLHKCSLKDQDYERIMLSSEAIAVCVCLYVCVGGECSNGLEAANEGDDLIQCHLFLSVLFLLLSVPLSTLEFDLDFDFSGEDFRLLSTLRTPTITLLHNFVMRLLITVRLSVKCLHASILNN